MKGKKAVLSCQYNLSCSLSHWENVSLLNIMILSDIKRALFFSCWQPALSFGSWRCRTFLLSLAVEAQAGGERGPAFFLLCVIHTESLFLIQSFWLGFFLRCYKTRCLFSCLTHYGVAGIAKSSTGLFLGASDEIQALCKQWHLWSMMLFQQNWGKTLRKPFLLKMTERWAVNHKKEVHVFV